MASPARDTCRDDAQLGARIRKAIADASVNEAGPMIAACQQRMGTVDLMSLKPLLLKSDADALVHSGRHP